MTTEQPSASSRFNALWEAANQPEGAHLVAVVDDPYVEGSLRPERKSLGGIVADELVCVTNTDVAYRKDDEETLAALAALESLLQ